MKKRAKKSLSQNFIRDKNICKKIVSLTNVKNKIILEVGPGYGFLTDVILESKPKKIILIEKDYYLFNQLKDKYQKFNNVKIINEDILNVKLNKFKNLNIISNLPYNISTKIILHLFKFNKNINEMIFMLQKEVAYKFDYILPGMNKYKFLTFIVSKYSKCFDVSSNVFIPKPKVKSTVVKFALYKNKKNNIKKTERFCKDIFKNVRKKIYKNIKLKNNNLDILNKRVNELSIKELLNIYNFF